MKCVLALAFVGVLALAACAPAVGATTELKDKDGQTVATANFTEQSSRRKGLAVAGRAELTDRPAIGRFDP